MAKRELYEEKTIMEKLPNGDTLFDRRLLPITEEEIVKPYLEKLKTEITGLKRFELRGTTTSLVNVDRAIELIDNLLTEKGAEK